MAMIPVAKIDRDPDQPRQEFDEEELGTAGRVAANHGDSSSRSACDGTRAGGCT